MKIDKDGYVEWLMELVLPTIICSFGILGLIFLIRLLIHIW